MNTSGQGISTDPTKIEVVRNWPTPKSVKHLRGFLGLTGYYRKFVKNYRSTSKPLMTLLKKDSFKWTKDAFKAFSAFKEAMVAAPVLALPNMNDTFVVETDASGYGIGVCLNVKRAPDRIYK